MALGYEYMVGGRLTEAAITLREALDTAKGRRDQAGHLHRMVGDRLPGEPRLGLPAA